MSSGEVLIKVEAAEVGVWDRIERQGFMKELAPAAFPRVLGGDGSGTIAAVGADVQGFRVGDKVYGNAFLSPEGGFYAGEVVLPADQVALVPKGSQAALALYGSEPVFMAQNAPAFIGRDAVQASYQKIFETIKLNVIFSIHEIVAMGDDLAYGRTTSAGQQEVLATHKLLKEANNELFIFRKERGNGRSTAIFLPPVIRPAPSEA